MPHKKHHSIEKNDKKHTTSENENAQSDYTQSGPHFFKTEVHVTVGSNNDSKATQQQSTETNTNQQRKEDGCVSCFKGLLKAFR